MTRIARGLFRPSAASAGFDVFAAGNPFATDGWVTEGPILWELTANINFNLGTAASATAVAGRIFRGHFIHVPTGAAGTSIGFGEKIEAAFAFRVANIADLDADQTIGVGIGSYSSSIAQAFDRTNPAQRIMVAVDSAANVLVLSTGVITDSGLDIVDGDTIKVVLTWKAGSAATVAITITGGASMTVTVPDAEMPTNAAMAFQWGFGPNAAGTTRLTRFPGFWRLTMGPL